MNRLLGEERVEEGLQRGLEMTEGDAFVHQETLYLMEHGRMAEVRIAAIDPTRHDDPDGRLMVLHVANLYRRCVRAQQGALIEVEGIVHGTGRVI